MYNEAMHAEDLRQDLKAKSDIDVRKELIETLEILGDLALIVGDLQRKLEDK